jgi:cell division protein FtsB
MPQRAPNKLQKVIFSLPFLVFLVAVVILVAVSAWNMYQTQQQAQETVNRLETQKAELLEREDTVASEALDLSTERGIEEEIREKFSVAKEGERVIVLVDDEEANATSTVPESSWWQSVLEYIWPF